MTVLLHKAAAGAAVALVSAAPPAAAPEAATQRAQSLPRAFSASFGFTECFQELEPPAKETNRLEAEPHPSEKI